MIRVDTRDLSAWADELGDAADKVLPEARNVVARGVMNIKRDARRLASGHDFLPHYPMSITYDIRQGGDYVEGEVGPDKNRRQGPLGAIIESGSVNSAPMPHMAPATAKELPRYYKALDDLLPKLLG